MVTSIVARQELMGEHFIAEASFNVISYCGKYRRINIF